jgi:hypothetical protein
VVLASRQIEGPLLGVLSAYRRRPTEDHLLRCFRIETVQEAAIKVAEEIRVVAMREDARRKSRRESLINYRAFYVGGVGVGLVLSPYSSRTYDWWAFAAYNTKPSKKACKFCAEMRIMAGARSAMCICLGGLAVVGVPQPDGRSNVLGLTLDPCEACRDEMRSQKYRTLFRSTTLVLTAQPESQLSQLRPLGELMRTHGETWP